MLFYPKKYIIDKTGNSSKITLPPEYAKQIESNELVALHCPEYVIYTEEKNVNKLKLRFSNL